MYDVNAKITHHFNNSNRLYASYYSSLDDSSIKEVINGGSLGSQPRERSESRAGVKWGNQTASLRYVSFIGKRWVAQSILYYTKYQFEGYNEDTNVFVDGTRTYDFTSNLSFNQDLGWKALMSYHVLDWKMEMGLEWVKQKFQPQSIFNVGNSINDFSNNTTATQQNYFFDLSFQPDSLLAVKAGVRFVAHHAPDTVFYVAEPRVKVVKRISPQLTTNFSANYGHQYLHLLTGGNAGLTNEIWLGSTRKAPPQRGWQTTLGLGWTSRNKDYAIEAEGFYKAMDNLTEIKSLDNNELTNLSNWEELIEVGGEGKAYGAELMLRKQTGKLTGWLAYTWSKSTRRFGNINRGNWFPFRFDRRHDISVVLLYALSEKWNLAATWGYQTGSYITLPVARIPDFIINDNNLTFVGGVDVNENRNNVRLPAYHRMDLSATHTWKSKKRQNQSSLSFSIYNVYNRINPYYIRTETKPVFDEQGQYLGFSEPKVIIVGLFPFIPSVSFSRDFGYGSK